MRFRQKLLVPFLFFPNPFSVVSVSEGRVRYVRFFRRTVFSLALDEVSARFDPRGFWGLFGYGDVTISDQRQSHTVHGVIRGLRLRDYIDEQRGLNAAGTETAAVQDIGTVDPAEPYLIEPVPAEKQEVQEERGILGGVVFGAVMVVLAWLLTGLIGSDLVKWGIRIPVTLIYIAAIPHSLTEFKVMRRRKQLANVALPVPTGVEFSHNVIEVPQFIFGLIDVLGDGHEVVRTRLHVPRGAWVERGQPLRSVIVKLGLIQSEEVPIPSPVSGIVLEMHPTMIPSGHILLPKGEPPPLPGSAVFGPLCDFLSEHQEYVFRKVELPGGRACSRNKIEELLAEQRSVELVTKDAWGTIDGRPTIQHSGMHELLSKRPDLASVLPPRSKRIHAESENEDVPAQDPLRTKDLDDMKLACGDAMLLDAALDGRKREDILTSERSLDPDYDLRARHIDRGAKSHGRANDVGNEVRTAEAVTEWAADNSKPSEVPSDGAASAPRSDDSAVALNVSDDHGSREWRQRTRYPPDIDALRIKWDLPLSYTRAQLDDRCEGRCMLVPAELVSRVHAEYDRLKPYADD